MSRTKARGANLRLIHPSSDDDRQAFADAAALSFAAPQEDLREKLAKAQADAICIVVHDEEVAGGLLQYKWGQWFGGRCVPSVGIGLVAVAPHHRAAGVATGMMRHQVRRMAAEGFPLSVLFPANLPLYRRAGYEIAGVRFAIEAEARSISQRDRNLSVRAITPQDEKAVLALYRTVARRQNGPLDRSAKAYKDFTNLFRGPHSSFGVWRGREMVGCLRYLHKWNEKTIPCRDVLAIEPAAWQRILAFFADHRQQATKVRWFAHLASPIFQLLEAPNIYKVVYQDHWMLRILDVIGALEARGYPRGLKARFDLTVSDDLLSRNRDRFSVQVEGGRCLVRRGGRGTIALDIRTLASLYTGYQSAGQLLDAGWLKASPDQAERLSSVFAGPQPHLPDFF